MGEVNWLATLLIGLVLTIPIGIFTNLLTTKIQDWLDKRSISTRGKRIEGLKKEYERIKEFREDQNRLNITIWRWIVPCIGLTIIMIMGIFLLPSTLFIVATANSLIMKWILTILGIILYLAIVIAGFAANNTLLKLSDDLRRLYKFDEYEKKVLEKMQKFDSKLKK